MIINIETFDDRVAMLHGNQINNATFHERVATRERVHDVSIKTCSYDFAIQSAEASGTMASHLDNIRDYNS
jgi:hypothetical protein